MTTSDPHDPLNDLLRQARWPVPTDFQRKRLELRWESLARERARKQLLRWAVAASVVLAIGIGWTGWQLLNSRESEVRPPMPNVIPPQMAEDSEAKPQPSGPAEPIVRPPTRYERLAFEVMVRRQQQLQVRRNPRLLIEAFHKILEQPEIDPAEVCKPLGRERLVYEELILARIGTWNREEQSAGLKILKEIGSPRAIPVLERLSRDPEFRKLAWPVALQLAPARLLAHWIRIGTPAQTKDAMSELLARAEDPQALDQFLRLVADPETRTPALEVVEAHPEPPVEALFAFLKQGTKEQRHTAGLVLGRIATPEIIGQLMGIARRQNFPPEVMIALLNSSDEKASQFLDQAIRFPQARSAVQVARLEWGIISYAATLSQPLENHE